MTKIGICIEGLDIDVSENNIHIEESYLVKNPFYMNQILKELETFLKDDVFLKDNPMNHRSRYSMITEWITHNNLWEIGYKRDHVESVDLNYPQKWYIKVLYFIGSLIIL